MIETFYEVKLGETFYFTSGNLVVGEKVKLALNGRKYGVAVIIEVSDLVKIGKKPARCQGKRIS